MIVIIMCDASLAEMRVQLILFVVELSLNKEVKERALMCLNFYNSIWGYNRTNSPTIPSTIGILVIVKIGV